MISVIIPVYNGERHLKNILGDLRNQEYKDFEVILVNDGSNDDSLKLMYDAQNNEHYFFEICIVSQENSGVSAARNRGIDRSKADFICFVDVDDRLDKQYLSHMISALIKYDAELVFCKTGNNTGEKGSPTQATLYSKEECLRRFLFNKLVSGVWSLLVRSSVIKDNELKFAEGYKYGEDFHMIWRLISCSDKIIELSTALYIYNMTEGSAMSKFGPEKNHSVLLMEDLEKYFNELVPTFYPLFKKYGVARMEWSVLWQATYHLDYSDFIQYISKKNYRRIIIKLLTFKKAHVALSSLIFCLSPSIFYYCMKVASKDFRNA